MKLATGVTVKHYNGLGFQKMKVTNPYLKKYAYCERSIFNYKTLQK